jgi:hypothetical protein
MKYTIKNFENQNGQKFVGFLIIDNDQKLAIDKYLPLVEGKSNEEYVQEAIALCQEEVNEWQQSNALVGKVWNSATNSFE